MNTTSQVKPESVNLILECGHPFTGTFHRRGDSIRNRAIGDFSWCPRGCGRKMITEVIPVGLCETESIEPSIADRDMITIAASATHQKYRRRKACRRIRRTKWE
jgi:hypothetical protein